MVQRDDERRSAFQGYTSVRQYVLENTKYHKEAYMIVRMTQCKDGSKEFKIVTSSGWSGARKHVFPKLLEAETEASQPRQSRGFRASHRRTTLSRCCVPMKSMAAKPTSSTSVPKKQKKYLMRGTIWVDAEDFAIVRMEGEPAKNPSFWIKSVQFAHKYEKHGCFWLAASDNSVSDARIFGPTELRIDYFDYVFNEPSREAKLR